jgi:hypothetical protein
MPQLAPTLISRDAPTGARVEAPDPRSIFAEVREDAEGVAMVVIKHLVALVDANVEVKLEIAADVPSGVPDDIMRTITENAKTLRFEQHGFAED